MKTIPVLTNPFTGDGEGSHNKPKGGHKMAKSFKSIIKRARRRKNPAKTKAKLVSRVKKALSSSVKTGTHRPRLSFQGGKWYRSKKSRLLTGPIMVNPKKRRCKIRRNPGLSLKTILNRQSLYRAALIAGGFTAGFMAIPVIDRYIPSAIKPPRKYYGVFHLALGLIAGVMVKNKTQKEFGLYLAASGMYDLLSQNLTQLGLPIIPTSSILMDAIPVSPEPQSGSYGVPELPVSPAARLAGSYQSVHAGYGGSFEDMTPTQGLGSDNPYAEIEGFQD